MKFLIFTLVFSLSLSIFAQPTPITPSIGGGTVSVIPIGGTANVTAGTNINVSSGVVSLADPATVTTINASILVVSNGIVSYTNAWSGAPTNTIDMSGPAEMTVGTWTSISVTGIINKTTNTIPTKTLNIYNLSATNQTITLSGGITLTDGTRQIVNTNGQEVILSIRYDPSLDPTNGRTNAAYVRNW